MAAELLIDAEFKRYVGDDAQPASKPFGIRLKIVSDVPPGIEYNVEAVEVSAAEVDEADLPVAIARLSLANTRRQAFYEGPRVGLTVETRNDAPALATLTKTLLVRRIGDEAWLAVDTFEPIPLPLEDSDGSLLEWGLPAAALQTWLRSGISQSAATIKLRLAVVPFPAGQIKADASANPLHIYDVELPIYVRGSPADILFWQLGNERFKTSLRSGDVRPKQTLPRLHSTSRGARDSLELGLEALAFDVWMLSDGSSLTLDTQAQLIDFDEEPRGAEHRPTGNLIRYRSPPTEKNPRSLSRFPLPELASELAQNGCLLAHARLDVTFRLRRGDDYRREMTVEIPISVDPELPLWFTCVDFGASAIAVGIAPGQRPTAAGQRSFAPLAALPLGEWFRKIDRFHPEIVPAGAEGAPASQPSMLLPSYVGLSSTNNLRARFDPLSYGDLDALLDEPPRRRLEVLGREYDVSVPFPSSDRLSDELGKVVFALKRELALGEAHVHTMTPVNSLRSGVPGHTNDLDVGRLFGDCFHELGSFIVPRALHFALGSGGYDKSNILRRFQTEIEGGRRDDRCVGVVMTHPFGLNAKQLAVYREAGRRFLTGLLGRQPDGADASRSHRDNLGTIVAIPGSVGGGALWSFSAPAAKGPCRGSAALHLPRHRREYLRRYDR